MPHFEMMLARSGQLTVRGLLFIYLDKVISMCQLQEIMAFTLT